MTVARSPGEQSKAGLSLCLLLLLVARDVTLAERVVLKDGFEVAGEIQTAEGQVHVRTPLQWYTFSTDQLLRTEPDLPSESAPEVYLLPNSGRKGGRRIEGLAGTEPLEPFDTFGRRRVHIKTSGDKELDVIQTIAEIHPTYVTLETLSIDWSTSLATAELSDTELLGLLDGQSKGDRVEDGIKLVHFLTQAGRYELARDRLKDLRTKFPAERSRLDEVEANWKRMFLAAAQRSVEQLVEAGDGVRASLIIREIAPRTDGEPQGVWRGFEKQLAQLENDLTRARGWIDESMKISSEQDRELAEEIVAHLNMRTIARLRPLLVLGDQESMTPAKRWSLAASGWIAGEKLAHDDPLKTASWIRHRALVRSVYRASSEEGFEIALDELRAARIPADEVEQLLRHLPAIDEAVEKDKIVRIEPKGGERDQGSACLAVLPASYSPAGSHPLLLVLHDAGMSLEETIAFWRETAGQLNAILVAPEYLLDEKRAYSYSLAEHEKLLATLAEMRRRFAVDSSRVFLAGHGIGGMAAFDFGWSHPGEWAGVIPIGGAPLFYMQYYWRNARLVPTYVVDGQLHGSNPALTRSLIQQNFRRGDPVISTLFVGRGPGRFSIELGRIADWMTRQKRVSYPPAIEGTSARHGDVDFYWLSIDGFLPKSTVAPTLFDKKKGLRPAKIEGKVEPRGTIDVTSSGVTGLDLKLSPALAPMGDTSFEVRYQRKVIHSGPIETDIETMLREARRTGDRDRLVHRIIKLK